MKKYLTVSLLLAVTLVFAFSTTATAQVEAKVKQSFNIGDTGWKKVFQPGTPVTIFAYKHKDDVYTFGIYSDDYAGIIDMKFNPFDIEEKRLKKLPKAQGKSIEKILPDYYNKATAKAREIAIAGKYKTIVTKHLFSDYNCLGEVDMNDTITIVGYKKTHESIGINYYYAIVSDKAAGIYYLSLENPIEVDIPLSYLPSTDDAQVKAIIEKGKEKIEARREEARRRVREEEAERKRKQDSIANQKRKEYINTHMYYNVPANYGSLYCIFCDNSIDLDSTIACIGANNDSIIWIGKLKGKIGLKYLHLHKAEISKQLKDYDQFAYHYGAFEDSLRQYYDKYSNNLIELYNSAQYYDYFQAIRKRAPYGFIGDKSWNIEYSNLSVSMEYVNTNKKTIKYIEMFWQTKNDVGDVRNRGSFRGTGPVKYWESAFWDWDNTSYYVAGDVTSFWVTKLVITYMDGTKKTLFQNQIIYDMDD